MDILEELRQQTEAVQANTEHPGDITRYQYSILLGRLKDIHDYLHKLTSKLNQLDHITTVNIHIPEIGTLSNLQQSQYALLWENSANRNRVMLNFCTYIKDACPINPDAHQHDKIEDMLTQAGIHFTHNRDHLALNGKINNMVAFCINPDKSDISLTINNFKHLGTQDYSISERLIDDNFFDQLGRFLLHRENNFIDQINSQLLENKPAESEDSGETESGINTQEMDVSRVRSLFTKEVQLYLTYHNSIKEINSKSADFIIGRSRQCNMVVNADLASRHHARIVYRKGKYVLVDQSTNGTFVKTQGGKEIYVQGEELPLSGSGFISLGKSVTVDNEHIIYFSCQ